MKINEENVVEYLRKKDEKALDFLIDNYGGLIKSIIGKHLYNLEYIQEECIDDVLLAVWNNINSFSEKKSTFKNWLAAVAKYKAINYKRKYLRILNEKNIEDINVKSSVTTEDIVMENELSFEVESLLNNLKKEDKDIFIKHYIEEKDVDIIAKNMGVRTSLIYNRLSRGRKKLKTILQGKEV